MVHAEAEDMGAAIEDGVGGGINRMLRAVSRLFESKANIEFTPVDGVFHADELPDREAPKRAPRKPVKDTHRVYTSGARQDHVSTRRLGENLDVRV